MGGNLYRFNSFRAPLCRAGVEAVSVWSRRVQVLCAAYPMTMHDKTYIDMKMQ